MPNGSASREREDALEISLRCTNCRGFRPFERAEGSKQVVSCAECGKRHSLDSLHAVDPDDPPGFDE